MAVRFDIEIRAAGTVTGLHYPANGSVALGTSIILAPGAGAPQISPFMQTFATGLVHRGADVVTFNFHVYGKRAAGS